MTIAEIILLLIMIALSLTSLILSFRHFKEKGYLLNNAFLYASKEERSRMIKTPYYKQSAIIFLLIGVMFLIISVEVFTYWKWWFAIKMGLIAVIIIFAIASTIFIQKRQTPT